MTQAELNDAISRATGDDIRDIRQRGFSLVQELPGNTLNFEASMPDPSVVDWDSPLPGATQSFYECC